MKKLIVITTFVIAILLLALLIPTACTPLPTSGYGSGAIGTYAGAIVNKGDFWKQHTFSFFLYKGIADNSYIFQLNDKDKHTEIRIPLTQRAFTVYTDSAWYYFSELKLGDDGQLSFKWEELK